MAGGPNWWENDPVAPTTFTGIPGAPKPKEPKAPVFVPEHATQIFDPNTNTYKPVPQSGVDPEKDRLSEAIRSLGVDELVNNVKGARALVKGGYSTGMTGAVLSHLPGTDARDFRATLEAIKGGIILEKMQALKEASKTGASGLGALSEKEGDRLAASVAALDPGMSDEKLNESLDAIEKHANFLRAVAEGKDPRDPKVAQQYGLADVPAGVDPNVGLDNSKTPAGSSVLTPEQEKAYRAFLGANPNPTGAQVKTFLEGLGVKNVVNADKIAEGIRKGQGISTAVRNYGQEQKVAARVQELEKHGLDSAAATAMGLGDTALGGFVDEGAATLQAASGALQGQGSFGDLYDTDVAANRQYQNDLSEAHPYYYGGGQFVGALALPTGKISSVADAAKVAGGYGALYGFGSGTDAGDRIGRAVVGGVGGAAVGGATGALAPLLADRLSMRMGGAPKGMAPDVAEAAARQNVSLIRPMVDESALAPFQKLAGTETAGPIIEQGGNRVLGDIEAATTRLGQGGNASNREAQGEALRTIAKNVQAANREGVGAAYEAARQVQPDAMVEPVTMRQSVDAKLEQLALRPSQNRAEITALKRYRADLDKPLPLQEVRNMRTDAYDNVYGGASSRSAEQKRADRFMMGVIDAANKDIEASLSPEAMAAYKAADTLHRENKALYKEAFKPLFGADEGQLDKLSAEQIHDKFKRAVNTNGRAIAAFHRRMPLEQSRDFAATIAERLGRSAPDAPFDAQLFLNQTKDFSPSATRTLFGPGGDQAIADLRLLSRKLIDTGANQTGVATRAGYLERQGWRQAARGFLSGVTGIFKSAGGVGAATASGAAGYGAGGATGMTVAAGTAAAIAGGREVRRVLSARAMTNPRVARWLAQTADVSSAKAAQEQVRKLAVIMAREPAIANDLQPLYQMINERITQPLAAQSGDQNEQR
jgi:hypothetical protein